MVRTIDWFIWEEIMVEENLKLEPRSIDIRKVGLKQAIINNRFYMEKLSQYGRIPKLPIIIKHRYWQPETINKFVNEINARKPRKLTTHEMFLIANFCPPDFDMSRIKLKRSKLQLLIERLRR